MQLHLVVSILSDTVCVISLLSSAYWLREIGRDVNKTLPMDERVEWSLLGIVPSKIHSIWDEHVRLFPASAKRLYFAISLLAFFLAPMLILTFNLLETGRP